MLDAEAAPKFSGGMSGPLVSIVIPCYNAEKFLGATLESALAQTYAPLEVIVVDDGSSDGSLALARSFESRGVRVFSQKSGNASATRNRGLREARGEYIQYLDADDLLHPDKVALQMRLFLEAEERGFVISGEWARFERSPEEAVFGAYPTNRDLSCVEFYQISFETLSMMQPAAWLSPRTLLDAAGPWDESLTLNDDGEYFSRVLAKAGRIRFCPGARVYYRSQVAGSLSRRKDSRSLESLYRSMELTLGLLLSADSSARTKAAAAYAWMWMAFELYPGRPDLADKAERASKALGGTSRAMPGGPVYQWLSRLLGWRLAKRLRERGNRLR